MRYVACHLFHPAVHKQHQLTWSAQTALYSCFHCICNLLPRISAIAECCHSQQKQVYDSAEQTSSGYLTPFWRGTWADSVIALAAEHMVPNCALIQPIMGFVTPHATPTITPRTTPLLTLVPHSQVGAWSDLQELVVKLLPSPQRCLDLIHSLLPQLASEVYQAFIAEVCTSMLIQPSLKHHTSKLLLPWHTPPSTWSHQQACVACCI